MLNKSSALKKRLTNEVNPVGAATTFQYDAKGNLTGTVDGEGNINAYVYDVIDRLTNFTGGRGNDEPMKLFL